MTENDASDPINPRQEKILSLLEERHSVEVTALSEALGVSAVTIRTDLEVLQNRMLLRRIRGGATRIQPARFERPIEIPSHNFSAQKERIGRLAASMVGNGETVILDAGTTTSAMAAALPKSLSDVVVITSSLDIAILLELHPGITVISTGGTLKKTGRNRQSRSLIPPYGSLILEQLNADCAFICCAGVDADRGFTNAHFEEVEIKRAMISSARRAIVLADHGKIGHVAGARIAALDEISALISDNQAAAASLAPLEKAGLQVMLA
ncbi:MAG: DeoR/GlpR family DNA-binding transcription regulator [Alphaproteobacteria bacterium]|nr:DeoR/GlpR family DNA-binding transcription regulator [Alphaproteobacteria bacterium]